MNKLFGNRTLFQSRLSLPISFKNHPNVRNPPPFSPPFFLVIPRLLSIWRKKGKSQFPDPICYSPARLSSRTSVLRLSHAKQARWVSARPRDRC